MLHGAHSLGESTRQKFSQGCGDWPIFKEFCEHGARGDASGTASGNAFGNASGNAYGTASGNAMVAAYSCVSLVVFSIPCHCSSDSRPPVCGWLVLLETEQIGPREWAVD
jgi:hypothetical protein